MRLDGSSPPGVGEWLIMSQGLAHVEPKPSGSHGTTGQALLTSALQRPSRAGQSGEQAQASAVGQVEWQHPATGPMLQGGSGEVSVADSVCSALRVRHSMCLLARQGPELSMSGVSTPAAAAEVQGTGSQEMLNGANHRSRSSMGSAAVGVLSMPWSLGRNKEACAAIVCMLAGVQLQAQALTVLRP